MNTDNNILVASIMEEDRLNMIEGFAKEINTAYDNLQKANKSVFSIFLKAYKELNNKEEFDEFLKKINLDNSSIKKLLKICKNTTIKANLDKLPDSWGTLYVLSRMKEEKLKENIENGKITDATTRSEAEKLVRNDNVVAVKINNSQTKHTSNTEENEITLKLRNKADIKRVEMFLGLMQEYFECSGYLFEKLTKSKKEAA